MNKTREIGGGNDYTDAQSLKKKKFDDLKSRFEETKSRPEEQAGMRADALGLKTAEKMDPKSVPANFFYVSVSGVIESGTV